MGEGAMRRVQSNVEVVVYALEMLGGAIKKVATEEIAAKAHELAPDRFSWVLEEYSHFPDKYVTKTALEDAAKKKTGKYVSGSYARDESKDGWTLTPEGIIWLEANRQRIAESLSSPDKRPSMPPIERRRFRSRIRDSDAYKSYSNQGGISAVTTYLFADLLQASPDAPGEILRSKLNRMLSIAELSKDEEVIAFLRACEERFSKDLGISKEDSDE